MRDRKPGTAPEAAPVLEDLLAAIAQRRDNFAINRKIDSDIVELMKKAGIYRALVSRQFGGDEKSPSDFYRMIERIAQVDGSAGWVASFGIAAIYLAILPIESLRELYADGPDIVFAGGNFPSQRAFVVPGGLRINGRWPWASGCSSADVIGVGIEIHDEAGNISPMMAIVPRARMVIEDDWNVNGLQGTGSYVVRADDVVVPERWTFVRGARPNVDAPTYRIPAMAMSSLALSMVGLGVARGAIDELIGMAAGRTSLLGGVSFANRPVIQIEIAKAEAALRAARAYFYETADDAYARASAGGAFDDRMVSIMRLAATHAATTGATVAQSIYAIAGTSGIFNDSRIGKALRDALVVQQHSFLSEMNWQSWGAALLDV